MTKLFNHQIQILPYQDVNSVQEHPNALRHVVSNVKLHGH